MRPLVEPAPSPRQAGLYQCGFLSPTLIGIIAAAVIIGGLSIALKVQSARLSSEQTAHAETKGKFAAFVAETKRMGEEAKKKAAAEIERQKEVTKERSTSYEKRLASLNATYRRLRDQRADPGGSPMPAVPDTARPADDSARDNRLLDLLQHAEKQTGQLIELQEWVREQGQAK